jgi:hypothetical protein
MQIEQFLLNELISNKKNKNLEILSENSNNKNQCKACFIELTTYDDSILVCNNCNVCSYNIIVNNVEIEHGYKFGYVVKNRHKVLYNRTNHLKNILNNLIYKERKKTSFPHFYIYVMYLIN